MSGITVGGGRFIYDDAHMNQHQDVLGLLPEALQRLGSLQNRLREARRRGDYVVATSVDFQREVGTTICVETSPDDQIVFAQRTRRKGLTRFVVGREPKVSSCVALILKHMTGDNYRLLTAWVGVVAAREPWDRSIKSAQDQLQANRFWSNHALIWGMQETIGEPQTFSPAHSPFPLS